MLQEIMEYNKHVLFHVVNVTLFPIAIIINKINRTSYQNKIILIFTGLQTQNGSENKLFKYLNSNKI